LCIVPSDHGAGRVLMLLLLLLRVGFVDLGAKLFCCNACIESKRCVVAAAPMTPGQQMMFESIFSLVDVALLTPLQHPNL
jgi:hypothetical protein